MLFLYSKNFLTYEMSFPLHCKTTSTVSKRTPRRNRELYTRKDTPGFLSRHVRDSTFLLRRQVVISSKTGGSTRLYGRTVFHLVSFSTRDNSLWFSWITRFLQSENTVTSVLQSNQVRNYTDHTNTEKTLCHPRRRNTIGSCVDTLCLQLHRVQSFVPFLLTGFLRSTGHIWKVLIRDTLDIDRDRLLLPGFLNE